MLMIEFSASLVEVHPWNDCILTATQATSSRVARAKWARPSARCLISGF
jgi:hypothetical protein